MYELKRVKKITECVKIGDDVVPVTLDPLSMCLDFNKKYTAIIAAEQEIQKLKIENAGDIQAAQEAYGNAIIAILNLVFGEAGAQKLLTFFEGDYVELLLQLLPFIVDNVVPTMTEALEQKRKQIAFMYKRKHKSR